MNLNPGMQMKKFIISMAISALTLAPFCVASGLPQVYQTIDKTHDLDVAPIDVTGSPDGKYTFVLAEGGKVLIFSQSGERHEIDVDPTMDQIFTSGFGEKIYLSSRKSKKLQEIFVDFEQNIDIDGSPFLGDENGAIVITAFSDFE